MKILTVRQPWAWAIIHGGKDIENRSMNIAGNYRGPVAIHAGKKRHSDSWALFERTAPNAQALRDQATIETAFGSIIGVVDLVDVHRCLGSEEDCSSATGSFPCSAWAFKTEKFHLVFANPRPIQPIPYKGFLGLRSVTEKHVLEEISAQLGYGI